MKETFDVLWKGLINKDESLAQPASRKDLSWSQAVLRVVLCFFMIWITFYFTSMVRTELVTIKKPVTIDNYQDILDKKGLIPVFLSSATDYHTFRDAPKESSPGLLWLRVQHQRGGYRSSFRSGSMEFIKTLQKLLDNEEVLISSLERSYVIRSVSCAMTHAWAANNPELSMLEFMRSWVRREPSTPAILRGHAFTEDFKDNNAVRGLQAVSENGLEKYIYTIVEIQALKFLKAPYDKKTQCMSNTLNDKSRAVIHPPSIVNFMKLFVYQYLLGLAIAFGSMLKEMIVWNTSRIINHYRRKKSPTKASFSW
jgi:hypothetical protein